MASTQNIHVRSSVKISGKTGGTLSITDSSNVTSALGMRYIHVRADDTVYLRISAQPTATVASGYRMEAGDILPLKVQPTDKIAAICDTGESATLYYHEVS